MLPHPCRCDPGRSDPLRQRDLSAGQARTGFKCGASATPAWRQQIQKACRHLLGDDGRTSARTVLVTGEHELLELGSTHAKLTSCPVLSKPPPAKPATQGALRHAGECRGLLGRQVLTSQSLSLLEYALNLTPYDFPNLCNQGLVGRIHTLGNPRPTTVAFTNRPGTRNVHRATAVRR